MEAPGYLYQQEQSARSHLRLVYDVDAPIAVPAKSSETELAANIEFQIWRGKIATSEVHLRLVGSEDLAVREETDILQRINEAKSGSAEANTWLEPNIASAVSEALFKDGHISEEFADIDEQGEMIQSGQPMSNIQANSYKLRPKNRHPILKKITDAEARNSFRIKHKLKKGELRDNTFIAVSLIPNNVPEKDLGHEGDGYFLERFTFVIQATSEVESGKAKIESGFMAGVDYDPADSFADKLEKRHDFAAVAKLYDYLGMKAPTTAEEILDNGFTIPNHMIPNGVADVMRLMDLAKDEVQGVKQARPVQDYIDMKANSEAKEASLKPMVKQVKKVLLERAGTLSTPLQATRLLNQLVRDHALKESYTNKDVDPLAFGKAAATYIEQIRKQLPPAGFINHEILQLMRGADLHAVVSMCGGGSGKSDGAIGELSMLGEVSSEGDQNGNKKGVLYCVTCPNEDCREFYDKLEAKGGVFTCTKCGLTAPA